MIASKGLNTRFPCRKGNHVINSVGRGNQLATRCASCGVVSDSVDSVEDCGVWLEQHVVTCTEALVRLPAVCSVHATF